MSLEFIAKIICDGCGDSVSGKPEHRSTQSKSTYWNAKDAAQKAGWLSLSRGRYRTEKHYCRACADKPIEQHDKRTS